MKELKIDPELKDLLPPLTDEEYKQLEKNIVDNGFDRNFPIMEWHGYIADGHNRYSICKKHNIEPVIGTLAYDTKEEVMEWMLDIQLGRRNLSPIQRIAIAEKYRPIYEKQAKRKLEEGRIKGGLAKPNSSTQNFVESSSSKKRSENETNAKLAKVANVNRETYRQAKRVLDLGNEDLKLRVLSGETSISAGYKELTQNKNDVNATANKEINNIPSSNTIKPTTPKAQISEETKQICADLKTEKTKEYLDSIWNYKIDFIECMNADANMFFDTLQSHFDSLNNLVTKKELNECIIAAKKITETTEEIIKQAETSTKTKSEDKYVN